jgi:16S rRNA (cytosine967-C5)-methyltransferase
LIDAPCSGLGVLKRNPDAKWKLKPEFIDNMRKIQSEVLESYSSKTRRKMVYATCSILPSENQEQIERFLTTDIEKSLNLSKTKKYWFRIWF